jgi:AcrR family transcriptional regulator
MATLTCKAEQTRQLILDTALELFTKRSYEAATMREIAAAANVSLGLAYRYFRSKESLVLALYKQMAEQTESAVSALPSGTIADRFIATMNARLNSVRPYRRAFGALFGVMMTPGADTAILGGGAREIRGISERTFTNLVQNSTDAVKSAHTQDFGKLLHSIHFAVIFYWLHDRSENQKSTQDLLRLIRGALPLLRRGMNIRPFSSRIKSLITILDSMFGAQ